MAKWRETPLDWREKQLFRGREPELNSVRALFHAPLPLDSRKVMQFSGVGGIGKSAFSRKIIAELQEQHDAKPDSKKTAIPPAFAALDFAEAWSRDPVQCLLQVRLQLGTTLPQARFPIFDFAFARLHTERFPSSKVLDHYGLLNPDGSIINRIAGTLPKALRDSKRVQDVADGIGTFVDSVPGLGFVYKELNRIYAGGQAWLDRRTLPLLREIGECAITTLDTRLAECLGVDISNALKALEPRPAVIVLMDTLEQITGAGAGDADGWIRELVWHARGVAFVLVGRDALDWPNREHLPSRDWENVIVTQELDALGEAEVDDILDDFPIVFNLPDPEPEIRAAIKAGAAGHPFYLGLQLDIYRDIVHNDGVVSQAHFGGSRKRVLERFQDHLDAGMRATMRTLAHARIFDEQLIEHLRRWPGSLIGPATLQAILSYSFVYGNTETGWRLHDLFREIEREQLRTESPALQISIDEALFAYWDARCQPEDARSVTQAHELALQEAMHHIASNRPAGTAEWLNSRWVVFFEAYRLISLRGLWEKAAEIASTEYGAESAVMAATLCNLGNVLERLDDLEGALAAQQRALAIMEKLYGPEHAQVAMTLTNLGNVLLRLDDLPGALAAQQRALAIKEKVYGPEHAEVAATLGNLGNVLERLDDLPGALAAQQRALAIKEKLYGPEHAEVAITLGNLGNVLFRLDDLEGALAAQQRALAIMEKLHGPEHAKVAITLGNLGLVLERLDDLPGALAAQQRALAIEEKLYGPEHAEGAITLGNLGVVLHRLHDLPAALAAQQRALAIFEIRLPPNHIYLAWICESLAVTLERLGKTDRAGALRARAKNIRAARG